jgi:predicted ATPase
VGSGEDRLWYVAPPPGTIRTPDQRLRVFVSSTLKELAPERKAARAAIERLHLAPVMFELGARPHPPRDLYRSYLNQSDIFVGLYWRSYGWVAPTEAVSGLEDEYDLASGLPKLIYIKEAGETPEPQLGELLRRIRGDDTASFKRFTDSSDLAELLETDLATLLAERFDESRAASSAAVERPALDAGPNSSLPAPLTDLIGRERETQAIDRMLRRPVVRLVTVTGPGGIGKTRLAIEVGGGVSDEFPDGVTFVDLAAVRDPALVPHAIAGALGVRDTGDDPLTAKLATALRRQHRLLILDNFEQVPGAAQTLTALLTAAPGLKMLVTSRRLLRVAGEYGFDIGPLELPRPTAFDDGHADGPCVALFVERAHAVKPDFELTADNAGAVSRICLALDGVPLAIELAAARIRILPPAALLARLDRRLPLLVDGRIDLPQRQQTLRATIEWSTSLLSEDENRLLAKLGVFEGEFGLEAAERVASSEGADTIRILGTLVDNSLVRERDSDGRALFSMLATVREYAVEQLSARGELDELRRQHADYFVRLAATAPSELKGSGQQEWLRRLADDRHDLRAAGRFLLDRRDWDGAAGFSWDLYLFWWIGGSLGEVRAWMDEVLAAEEPITDRTRAVALYFTRAITFWQDPDGIVVPGLTESAELFHRESDAPAEALALISLALALLAGGSPEPATEALESGLALVRQSGDRWEEGMTLVSLGRVSLLRQNVTGALERFTESLSIATAQRDEFGQTIALHHLGWAQLLLEETDLARGSFEESLAISARLGHDEGVAYGLEGLVAIAAAVADVRRAGILLGAAEGLRDATGLYNAPTFSFHQRWVDPILSSDAAPEFEAARGQGRALPVDDAVDFALLRAGEHPETPAVASDERP